MNIVGFLKNSFIDYPGLISCVIFTPGCNMNCWYCHNKSIITLTKGTIEEDEIFNFLEKRKGQIDAVVISGGEATLQTDLVEFISKIKKLGFMVKLDTNGTNTSVLKELVNKKLINYIAMDVKAPLNNYNKVTYVQNINEIKNSIEYIKTCGIDYEFRTTFAPNLTKDDIIEILKSISGAKRYSLQAYMKPSFIKEENYKLHQESIFLELKELGQKYVSTFLIKNL